VLGGPRRWLVVLAAFVVCGIGIAVTIPTQSVYGEDSSCYIIEGGAHVSLTPAASSDTDRRSSRVFALAASFLLTLELVYATKLPPSTWGSPARGTGTAHSSMA
jgi:hypothetical protein